MLKYSRSIFLVLCFIISTYSQNRIKINIPTPEDEAAYVWQTLRDIPFFEKNNYKIALPKGEMIEKLKQKAKSKTLNDNDFEAFEKYFINTIYNREDYLKGFNILKENEALLNRIINKISKNISLWTFVEFDTYKIDLTLYGPGGGYNPDMGTIVLFATKDGKFKQYGNPSNTIIHEIVHIGMEKPLILKHNVPHWLKERIIDLFVKLNFGHELPDYRLQPNTDKRIDDYLKTAQDFDNIEDALKKLLNTNADK